VLVSVFPQPAPHVAQRLMTPKSSTAHLNLSKFAGATRADVFRLWVVISGAPALVFDHVGQAEGASQVTAGLVKTNDGGASTHASVR